MTQPENFTAAQASDPATPGQVLADIAALRPDLRPAVASNPSAYPGLIDWLKSLGEPAVDAALAARETAPAAAAPEPAAPEAAAPEAAPQAPGAPTAATQVLPTAPTGAPVPPATGWPQQQQPFAAAPPAGAPGMPAPGMPAPGMPAPAMGAPGMPPGGYPPPGVPPQGGLPYGAPPPQQGSSNKALWIVLIILGVVALLSVGGYFIARALTDKASDTVEDVIDDITEPSINTYGDDADLDALWDACEAEDWEACDDLYWDSPAGSEYEEFGDTCGNRQDADTGRNCVGTFTETDPPTDDAQGYGDDPALDALWDACEAEDWAACDDLYWQSPLGSEYEEFGDTCGNRTDGALSCATEFDVEISDDAQGYGDDPTLDALWDACAGGDNASCDDLFWDSPLDSEYEDFGWTCGGRKPAGGLCDD